jgi:hypothetical protein
MSARSHCLVMAGISKTTNQLHPSAAAAAQYFSIAFSNYGSSEANIAISGSMILLGNSRIGA